MTFGTEQFAFATSHSRSSTTSSGAESSSGTRSPLVASAAIVADGCSSNAPMSPRRSRTNASASRTARARPRPLSS